MNKTDLINQLAERLDGDKKAAQAAVEGFIDLVQREVQKGRNVSISGFGVFEKRPRAARTARNPRTGEAVKVKKTTVPAFRPGQVLQGRHRRHGEAAQADRQADQRRAPRPPPRRGTAPAAAKTATTRAPRAAAAPRPATGTAHPDARRGQATAAATGHGHGEHGPRGRRKTDDPAAPRATAEPAAAQHQRPPTAARPPPRPKAAGRRRKGRPPTATAARLAVRRSKAAVSHRQVPGHARRRRSGWIARCPGAAAGRAVCPGPPDSAPRRSWGGRAVRMLQSGHSGSCARSLAEQRHQRARPGRAPGSDHRGRVGSACTRRGPSNDRNQ